MDKMEELRDKYGRTAEEFGKEHFEFEYCAECGGDWDNHDYILMEGNYFGKPGLWFARCKEILIEEETP